MGAAAARASRRGSCGVRARAHARQARNRPVGSRPRGAAARNDDGRRTRCDGRGGFAIRCSLDRWDEHGYRCALRGHLSRALRRPHHLRPEDERNSIVRLPWAPTEEDWHEQLTAVRAGWGERGYLESLAREWAPEVAEDERFRNWFVMHMRRSLSPGAALTSFRTAMELDVRDVLAAVRVPTLVIPRPALPAPGHYTAEQIRGSEVVELPELRGVYTWVDDAAHRATMAATQRIKSIGTARSARVPSPPSQRLTRRHREPGRVDRHGEHVPLVEESPETCHRSVIAAAVAKRLPHVAIMHL